MPLGSSASSAAAAGPAAAAPAAPPTAGASHKAGVAGEGLLAPALLPALGFPLPSSAKKTVSWFAAGARYGPEGEGVVVWVTRGAVTSRRQVEHRAPIGQTPPNVAKVVLDLSKMTVFSQFSGRSS